MAKGEGLSSLDDCLADGRLDDLRDALVTLDEEDRRLLEAELGPDATRRVYRSVRRRRRRKLGRVIVLNGIMGALLDVIKGGDRDRVWLNYWRIFNGRMSDLELRPDGTPKPNGVAVEVAGLYRKTYLPLVLELDGSWDVLPFGYDWRADIRLSARRLADAVRRWSGGEPVHLVAHSMGGLVSRAFIRQFPDLWEGMRDPAGRSGGRLIMLGTPNRGSFAISLMLTAEEKMVRQLALLDRKHDVDAVLSIVKTFSGGYQMLPSRLVDLADDHVRLFDRRTWGRFAGRQAQLDDGDRFQQELHEVATPDRLVYVAGYDQETPHRIRVLGPGRFEYRSTRAGDGRVPHELGLLPRVPTQWVREIHGDLPKNGDVLAGIHDLLLTGETGALETRAPVRRRSDTEGRWLSGPEIEPVAESFERDVETVTGTLRARKSEPAPRPETSALEAAIGEDWLGTAPARGATRRGRRATEAPREPLRLNVRVYWGDIRKTRGDVYCVGHYEGVSPQRAERALDAVVSLNRREQRRLEALLAKDDRRRMGEEFPRSRFVLTSLTERGALRGSLGEVNLYPWADPKDRQKMVAVAGMGQPGTFDATALRELGESLAWTVGSLRGAKTVCSVLIGSGEGGMGIDAAARGLIEGITDAAARGLRGGVGEVRIVENDYSRAHRTHDALLKLVGRIGGADLRVGRRMLVAPGGRISEPQGLAFVLAAASAATRTAGRRAALDTILGAVATDGGRRRRALEAASELTRRDGDVERIALRLKVGTEAEVASGDSEVPARMFFTRRGRGVRVSAINDTAVVAERDLGTDFALVEELADRTTDPDPEVLGELARSLRHRLLPRDFRDHVAQASPKVFALDRDTAIVHWELMALGDKDATRFLGLEHQVARQLLTAYSPRPEVRVRPDGPLRALVIGDPGDPDAGDDLPGAREEASRVADYLATAGVDVVSRIGAPGRQRTSWGGATGPATRLEVLHLLDSGSFDLLHYCGHGDFDPSNPSATGWLFQDGILTAGELETVDRAPRLVVANACLSARTSRAVPGGRRRVTQREAGLLPSLADEFLRRGVHNYIGTAWEVSDEGAILFALTLYERLLGPAERPARGTIGESVLEARRKLAEREKAYGALWLAYQHYGDPAYVV